MNFCISVPLNPCLTYEVESKEIRDFVTEKKDIPFMQIETDYSKTDIEQLKTRVTAFIEML